MKKILITGADSYIGVSFEKYLNACFPCDYSINTIDMIDGSWKEKSFAGFDSVFHVAGIAHQKETKANAHLYYEVNRDLALETAKKAKADGVKQFVFLSSMSVYGMDTGIINRDTPIRPKSHYGRSKAEAEEAIELLNDDNFRICIIRPPMVYGKGCKGNFNSVCSIVRKLPFFPRVRNRRSMIYIDNLSSFVRMCVDEEFSGVYFPQNRHYVATMDMAKGIASAMNKKICFEYLTGWAVSVLKLFLPVAKKAFGSLVYEDMEDFSFSYIVTEQEESFTNSIK